MAKLSGRQKSEAKRQIIISDPSICYYCKSTGLTANDKFCSNCGFPQRGSQLQMRRFIGNIRNKKKLLSDMKNSVMKAKGVLFGLSAFTLIFGILRYENSTKGYLFSGYSIVAAAAYLYLAILCRTNAYKAILFAFVVYVAGAVFEGLINPYFLLDQMKERIIEAIALFYGFKGAKDSAVLEKELAFISKARDVSNPYNIPDAADI